jgi:hypothetical protein
MDMDMHHRLARRLTIVDTDIETGRGAARDELATTPIQQRKELASLLYGGVEKGRNVALRRHQRMARRDGIAVGEGEAKRASL